MPSYKLVRTPQKLPEDLRTHQNVTITQGDVQNAEKVKDTIKEANYVIVSLGGDNLVCSTGQRVINDAIAEVNPGVRVVTVTSMGVGDSYPHLSFLTKQFVDWVINAPIQDKNKQEAMITSELKNWVLVRPGGLNNGEATGKINAGFDIGSGTISRADVAQFILNECLAEDTKWLNKAVTIVGASGWF